jgi:protein arginine kinase
MYNYPFWYEGTAIDTGGIRPSVLSTRVRVARNISGLAFPGRMSLEQSLSLRASILRVLSKYQFLECSNARGVGICPDDFLVTVDSIHDGVSVFGIPESGQIVVIGDEDHFRISTVALGLSLEDTVATTFKSERSLATEFTFAFDKNRFGFLTASMANAGLAMRVSVWMHLPGLVLTGKWSVVEPLLVSLDMSVRGILGEASAVTAGMVQLSNRTSYGRTADDLVSKLTRVISLVEAAERDAVSELLREHRSKTINYLKWMSLFEQPFISRDDFVHAVSAALLAARLGYNVRFDTALALRVLVAGFKSRQQDGLVRMQVVRGFLKDTLV